MNIEPLGHRFSPAVQNETFLLGLFFFLDILWLVWSHSSCIQLSFKPERQFAKRICISLHKIPLLGWSHSSVVWLGACLAWGRLGLILSVGKTENYYSSNFNHQYFSWGLQTWRILPDSASTYRMNKSGILNMVVLEK